MLASKKFLIWWNDRHTAAKPHESIPSCLGSRAGGHFRWSVCLVPRDDTRLFALLLLYWITQCERLCSPCNMRVLTPRNAWTPGSESKSKSLFSIVLFFSLCSLCSYLFFFFIGLLSYLVRFQMHRTYFRQLKKSNCHKKKPIAVGKTRSTRSFFQNNEAMARFQFFRFF